MGIAIDILVALFLVWSLLRGWTQGLLYQLGQMALVVLGYFVARGLGGFVADPIAKEAALPPHVADAVGFFAIFLLVVLIGAFFVRKITRDLLSLSDGLSTTDRAIGVLVGGAKGLLIAYLVIVGLIMAHRMTGKLPIPFASSIAGRWVMQHNFLDSGVFPGAKALAKLAWLVSTRDSQQLAGDPHVQALMANPKAQTLIADPEVLRALGAKDYLSLLGNETVWTFLDDPQVQAHLDAIEWTDDGASALPAEHPVDGPLHPSP
ncbi:MAG: hypothetical protein CSA66_03300 [Proteobacteria bacterium]|nr:MAG: hypothetical protein CSA66_03300 [Pseudomonadota bacterium]